MKILKGDRILVIASLTAILLAAGFLAFLAYQKTLPESVEISSGKITALINNFRSTRKPLSIIVLEPKWQSDDKAELLDPRNMAPLADEKLIQDFYLYSEKAKNCDFQNWPVSEQLRKLKIWSSFKCGRQTQLKTSLWRKSPLIHPLGGTWLWWLHQQGYGQQDFLITEKSYLHMLELKNLPAEDLTDFEKIVSDFTPEELAYLNQNKGIVVSSRYVLIASYYSSRGTPFAVYPRKDWDLYLAKNRIFMSTASKTICSYEDRMYCWGVNMQSKAKIDFYWLTSILLVSIIVLCYALISSIAKKKRVESALIESQQLIVQTLAHELRHPVTGFKLSIEAIRPHFKNLPESVVPEFLRLISISERMTRLVRHSQQYLQLLFKDKQFSFQKVLVSSWHEYLDGVLSDYQNKIIIQQAPQDQSVYIDPYWLATCIKNLVINALTHGKPPIIVRWSREGDQLVIAVEDAGESPNFTVEDLESPILKRSGSEGLGLGLSLIAKLTNLMQGQLILKKNPTIFLITLRGVFKDVSSVDN